MRAIKNRFAEKVSLQAHNTLASAIQIGNPVSYVKAVQAVQKTNGIVAEATEHELANAAGLADKTGMYACPHTAVALAVLFKLVNQGSILSQDRVIVISTAHGLKFTNFKVNYHDDHLDEVEAQYANPPLNLPADAGLVKEDFGQNDCRRRPFNQSIHTILAIYEKQFLPIVKSPARNDGQGLTEGGLPKE